MIGPADLDLTYTDWRAHQWEAITQAATSPAKLVVIEAPVGSGKSGIALGYAHATGAQHTHILTSTKQLQEQYLTITEEIRQVKGRANFGCPRFSYHTAATAPCTQGEYCPAAGLSPTDEEGQPKPSCGYWDQKREAIAAREAVFNYAYALADYTYAHSFPRPDVLVLDEAHAIEDHLRQFVEVRLNPKVLRELRVAWPRYDLDDWQMWQRWAREQHGKLRLPRAGSPNYQTVQNLKQKLRILSQNLGTDWLITEVKDPRGVKTGSIQLQPVWTDRLVPRYLLRKAERVVLMSATVRPPDLFCELLGIDPADAEFIEVPSTFPAGARPLYYQPVGKLSHTMDDALLERLVQKIDEIARAHPHEKGLVHTVSYKLQSEILRRSREAGRMLVHSSDDRTSQLEAFKRTAQPAILLSPSMTTGVDLPYDQCRWQVIAKLPFPNKADPQVARRLADGERGKRWYDAMTGNDLMQAYGRGMRAADDACATYLLDEQFTWFRSRNRGMFPRWFSEAIHDERSAYRVMTVRDFMSPSPSASQGVFA